MVRRLNKALTIGVAAMLLAAPTYAQQPSSSKRVSADPNERVCEDIIATGSRLATKRICATRAEWEAMKKADRDVVEDAQRHANDPCNTINTHSGGVAC